MALVRVPREGGNNEGRGVVSFELQSVSCGHAHDTPPVALPTF